MAQQNQQNKLPRAVSAKPQEVDIPTVDAESIDETEIGSVTDQVTVIHGSEEGNFDLTGKTIGFVRENLGDLFNIPGDAQPLVNGDPVQEGHVLKQQDVLEFVKQAGTKG